MSEKLEFRLVSTDGGQHSSTYRCENMLAGNTSVYCSQKANNINIVLEHAKNEIFCLEMIVVKGPEQHFTAPIGTGFVFVSFDPPNIESTAIFDSMEERDYEKYQTRKMTGQERMTESDPVVFFDAKDHPYLITKHLETKRYGRYIHIKLIRSANFGTNIDIQYMGFYGFVGPEQKSSPHLV